MRKSFLRKTILYIALSAVMITIAYAVTISIPHWYSDQYVFNRFAIQPVVWRTHYDNLFSDSVFNQCCDHAVSEWNENDVTVGTTAVQTESSIKIYGGSYAKMEIIDPEIGSDYGGRGVTTSIIEEVDEYSTGFLGLTKITGNVVYNARIVVIYKSNIAEGTNYVNYYKNIITHEMGHTLGWYGHSTNNSDLMYKYAGPNITTVQERDKMHVKQVYDKLPY